MNASQWPSANAIRRPFEKVWRVPWRCLPLAITSAASLLLASTGPGLAEQPVIRDHCGERPSERDHRIGTAQAGTLPAGGYAELCARVASLPPGVHRLRASIDREVRVLERNTENNVLIQQLDTGAR